MNNIDTLMLWKVFRTNWVHLIGIYLSFLFIEIHITIVRHSSYTLESMFLQKPVTALNTLYTYGLPYLGFICFMLLILDTLLFGWNLKNIVRKLSIELIFFIGYFVFLAWTDHNKYWLAFIVPIFLGQYIRMRMINKLARIYYG